MRIRRLIGGLLVAVALAAGAEYFALVDRYARTLPQSPEPEHSAVIPMDDHGTRVFLTGAQENLLWGLQVAAIIVGGIGGLLMRGVR